MMMLSKIQWSHVKTHSHRYCGETVKRNEHFGFVTGVLTYIYSFVYRLTITSRILINEALKSLYVKAE